MNAFSWRGQPSEIAQSLKPHPMARVSLAPKRMHIYAVATSADKAREAEIEQLNREVEQHFSLAQMAPEPLQKTHRDEARRLAARVKALVGARSEAYVAYLEQQRGLG